MSIPDNIMAELANLQAQVPKENVTFVEKHSAEIEDWAKKSGKVAKSEKADKVAVKPNTLEDIYIPADSTTPKESPKDKAPRNP